MLKKLKDKGIYKGSDNEPERLRNAALTQIEEDVYKEGITASEEFGQIIEGIPLAGGLIAKYAGDLVETPGGNIQQMRKTIKKEKTRMTVSINIRW